MPAKSKNVLTKEEQTNLLATLQTRFAKNIHLHKGILWANVLKKLLSNTQALWAIQQMEITGGEPDVVEYDSKANTYCYVDCAAESPAGRRSCCYDMEGLQSRKEHAPKTNAVDMAAAMGVQLLTEQQYRALQQLGSFDTKTSSWLLTPPNIRKLGGSIFGDCRYDTVFIYHNGAQSYYGGRGFRGCVYV